MSSTRLRVKGLAKARLRRAFTVERVTRARSEDAYWRDLFKSADVVSEGAVQTESASYYGMTDIVVPFPSEFGSEERSAHLAVARACVHVKLRALRVARREAQTRANVDLEASHCEVAFSEENTRLRIHVELSAKILHKNSRGTARVVRKVRQR